MVKRQIRLTRQSKWGRAYEGINDKRSDVS